MWLIGAFLTAGIVVASQVATDPIQYKAYKKCGLTNCLKLDLLRLVSKLGNITQIPLGPGVSLVGTERTQELALALSPHAISSGSLQQFLQELLIEYIGSLNLTLQLKESSLLDNLTGTVSRGRSRKYNWYYIIVLASAAFALLAALCGKALMASMLALMISALLALRTSAIGFAAAAAASNPSSRITQYEIISKPISYVTAPAHYYDEHHHHHTTEDS